MLALFFVIVKIRQPRSTPTTIILPDVTKASLARILDLLSVGRSTSSTKCNLKEVIKTVGDAKLLDIDISNLVEVDGGVSEQQADLSEDKEALRERLRLMRVDKERQVVQRVGKEEQVRLEKADKQARIARVENLLQKVRTDLSEKSDYGAEIQDSGKNAEIGSSAAKDVHECQKCGEHLQEASIEMWEHYTNHYKSAILRFCQYSIKNCV